MKQIAELINQKDLLEKRKELFKKRVWEAMGKNFKTYSKEMSIEFVEYWTEHNEPVTGATKMRFEKEQTFQLSRRLSTWKRNNDKWTPQYKKQGLSRPFPLYYDRRFASKLDPIQHHQYKIHLQSRGFIFGGGATGQWIKPPEGERIWIS